jgi:hypothetical protein
MAPCLSVKTGGLGDALEAGGQVQAFRIPVPWLSWLAPQRTDLTPSGKPAEHMALGVGDQAGFLVEVVNAPSIHHGQPERGSKARRQSQAIFITGSSDGIAGVGRQA